MGVPNHQSKGPSPQALEGGPGVVLVTHFHSLIQLWPGMDTRSSRQWAISPVRDPCTQICPVWDLWDLPVPSSRKV